MVAQFCQCRRGLAWKIVWWCIRTNMQPAGSGHLCRHAAHWQTFWGSNSWLCWLEMLLWELILVALLQFSLLLQQVRTRRLSPLYGHYPPSIKYEPIKVLDKRCVNIGFTYEYAALNITQMCVELCNFISHVNVVLIHYLSRNILYYSIRNKMVQKSLQDRNIIHI